MSFLVEGLTTEEASRICMERCRAMCCRGPLILELAAEEAEDFRSRADALGMEVDFLALSQGRAGVRFSDYPGECCPMLDRDTFACRIYRDRPERCRRFPERLTPGCAISGG